MNGSKAFESGVESGNPTPWIVEQEGNSDDTGDISKMRSGDVGHPGDEQFHETIGRRRFGISMGMDDSLRKLGRVDVGGWPVSSIFRSDYVRAKSTSNKR